MKVSSILIPLLLLSANCLPALAQGDPMTEMPVQMLFIALLPRSSGR
jgi:hypothetical protein